MLSSNLFQCELPDKVYDEVVFQRGAAHWNILKIIHFTLIMKVGNIFINNVGFIKNTMWIKND